MQPSRLFTPLLLAAGALLSSLSLNAAPSGSAPASTVQPASTIDWNAYKGKVVLVDFWATWCGPCRQSFPWMKAMQQKYGKDGLAIVAVNVDREPAKVAAFMRDFQPNFDVRSDPDGKLAKQFNVQGMPSTFILGRDGKPAAKHQGFFAAKTPAYEAELAQLLKKSQ